MSKKPPNDPLCQRANLTGVPQFLIELARERYLIRYRIVGVCLQVLLGITISTAALKLEDRLFVFSEPYDLVLDVVSFAIFLVTAFFMIRMSIRLYDEFGDRIRRI